MDKGRYEEIDIEALACTLAESDWKDQTRSLHLDQLYNIEIVEEPSKPVHVVKEVNSRWATTFLQLKEEYTTLIMSFTKPESDGTDK